MWSGKVALLASLCGKAELGKALNLTMQSFLFLICYINTLCAARYTAGTWTAGASGLLPSLMDNSLSRELV